MTAPEPQTDTSEPTVCSYQFGLRTLFLLCFVLASSLALFGTWGIVVFPLAVGAAVFLNQVESLSALKPLVKIGFWSLCLLGLWMLLMPHVGSRENPARMNCYRNLKRINLALYQYYEANGCLPPAYIADKSGKPMHSWRVLILPHLGFDSLYKAYDFTEPWDGPKNKRLLAARPEVYVCPGERDAGAGSGDETSYLAPVGPTAAWAGATPRTIQSEAFARGTSNTIMLVEAADSGVAWTEPRDLSIESLDAIEPRRPALDVAHHHGRREEFFSILDYRSPAIVAYADGSVHALSYDTVAGLRQILESGKIDEEGAGRSDMTIAFQKAVERPNWRNIIALPLWLLAVGLLLAHAIRSRRPSAVLPTPPARPDVTVRDA